MDRRYILKAALMAPLATTLEAGKIEGEVLYRPRWGIIPPSLKTKLNAVPENRELSIACGPYTHHDLQTICCGSRDIRFIRGKLAYQIEANRIQVIKLAYQIEANRIQVIKTNSNWENQWEINCLLNGQQQVQHTPLDVFWDLTGNCTVKIKGFSQILGQNIEDIAVESIPTPFHPVFQRIIQDANPIIKYLNDNWFAEQEAMTAKIEEWLTKFLSS